VRRFRIPEAGRRKIAAAFPVRVPAAQRKRYIRRAESVLDIALRTEARARRAKAANRKLLRALRRWRAATEEVLAAALAATEEEETGSSGLAAAPRRTPLYLAALKLKQEISPVALARLDPQFELPAPRSRPPAMLQTIVVVNLRHALLMATAIHESDCWRVLGVTLRVAARAADMPPIALTDDVKRRALAAAR